MVNIFEYSPTAASTSHPFGSDQPDLASLLIKFFNFLCAAAVDCEREADEQISSSQQQQQQQQIPSASSSSTKLPRPSSSDPALGASGDGALEAVLQAAGTRHMELNFLAACCCIIIYHATSVDIRGIEKAMKKFKGENFDIVVDVLKRFLTFTALVNGADERTLETVAQILEKYDAANKAAGFGQVSTSNPSFATPPGTSGTDDDEEFDDADGNEKLNVTVKKSASSSSTTSFSKFVDSRFRNVKPETASASTTAVNGDSAYDFDESD